MSQSTGSMDSGTACFINSQPGSNCFRAWSKYRPSVHRKARSLVMIVKAFDPLKPERNRTRKSRSARYSLWRKYIYEKSYSFYLLAWWASVDGSTYAFISYLSKRLRKLDNLGLSAVMDKNWDKLLKNGILLYNLKKHYSFENKYAQKMVKITTKIWQK